MGTSQKPDLERARYALPIPLFKALEFIFSHGVKNCMLAGGTALSGFYAAHRRSDDLDFFVKDSAGFHGVRRACVALTDIGAKLTQVQHTRDYYHAVSTLDSHTFTIDIVVDENIFSVGDHHAVGDNLIIADLSTLLKMKAAALLSRCSEKDLYDLLWLFGQFAGLEVDRLISMGAEIDAGMDAEALLYSVASAPLSEESCGFALNPSTTAVDVFKQIKSFQRALIRDIQKHLRDIPTPPLQEIVARLKRM